MSAGTTHETYEYQLRTVYHSETAFITAFTRLIDRVHSTALKSVIHQHLSDTQRNTRQVQALLPNTPGSDLDPQLAEEAASLVNEVAQIIPDRRAAGDAAVLDVVRQMLHFEIAAYTKLVSHASQLNEQEHRQQFEASLTGARGTLNRLEQQSGSIQSQPNGTTDTFKDKGAVEEDAPRPAARATRNDDAIENINAHTSLDDVEDSGVDNIEDDREDIREDLKDDPLGGSTQLNVEKAARGVLKS